MKEYYITYETHGGRILTETICANNPREALMKLAKLEWITKGIRLFSISDLGEIVDNTDYSQVKKS